MIGAIGARFGGPAPTPLLLLYMHPLLLMATGHTELILLNKELGHNYVIFFLKYVLGNGRAFWLRTTLLVQIDSSNDNCDNNFTTILSFSFETQMQIFFYTVYTVIIMFVVM